MAHLWRAKPKVPAAIVEKFPEIDPLLLQLLYTRNLTEQEHIDAFLDPDYSRDLHDPFRFRAMERAVERIEKSLRTNELIVVYGDYDADGVCASAVLAETIIALGGDVQVYIPYRESEGYGLNVDAIEEIARQGTTLIITVDCGTSNPLEVARAAKLGMDVIVTDHHDEPPELPRAFALINPELKAETYPFRHLSAAGVAFKVAVALLQHTSYGKSLGRKPLPVGWEKWLLDLVATSTVADMVPLTGENRVFVRFGLSVLRKGRRIGFTELFTAMRSAEERADEDTLAFQVAPRLNAAGRMNHASTAYRLLVTTDAEEAKRLAAELSQANLDRQRATELAVQHALAQIGRAPSEKLLVVISKDWQVGILGLVASRLVETFHRPAIAMTHTQDKIVGSGRSIPRFDITAALVTCREFLERFGGHPQACGFTLQSGKDPLRFGRALQQIAMKALEGSDDKKTIFIDAEVVLDDINWELVENVERLAPFGIGAERPRFLSRGVKVVSLDTVGKDGQHLRMHVTHATSTIHKTIGFRFGSWVNNLQPNNSVDIVFEVGVNEWNGSREIELKIVDLDYARP